MDNFVEEQMNGRFTMRDDYKFFIPNKMIKEKRPNAGKGSKVYHYELYGIYDNVVVYTCLETGTKESFSKKDFIKFYKKNDKGDYEDYEDYDFTWNEW